MRPITRPRAGFGPAILLAILTLVASGCGSSDADAEPSAEDTTPPAAAATEAPADVEALPFPETGWPEPDESLDVLFIAHINDLGEAIPEMFAEHITKELGNDVAIHYPSGMHTGVSLILGHMGGGRFPDITNMVQKAEIIVLQTWPSFHSEGDDTPLGLDRSRCSSGVGGEAPTGSGAEYWQPYRDALDSIYEEIWRLREDSPTLIIALDLHDAYLHDQREAGIDAPCRAWHEAWSDVTGDAAAANGGVMVSVYDVLNGSAHDVDPAEMGYLGATHRFPTLRWRTPNEVGGEMVANLLATVDLEPGSA